MKHIKSYKVYENSNNPELIKKLSEFGIINYTINSDGAIDVDDHVDLFNNDLITIPFRFGRVAGDFSCSSNRLTSLKGCPKEVGGNFYCNENILVGLIGGPEEVSGSYHCSNNKITSLRGCPKEINGDFDCGDNRLKDLIGGPQEVVGSYFCNNNRLESLEGCAGDISRDLYCYDNNLEMLDCSSVINGYIGCQGNNFKEYPEFFGVCGGEIYWK